MSEENKNLNNEIDVEENVSDVSEEFSETKTETETEIKEAEGEKSQPSGIPVSRKLKRGGFSVAITLIFIAAVILVNVIVNTLLARFDVRLDLTEQGLYSIEKSTADYLAAIDSPINFYFCASEDFLRTRIGQVVEIAERFVESNPNFTISFVDRLADPMFSVRFGGNLTDTDVVIESEKTGRYRVVGYSEYLVIEYFVGGQPVSESEAMIYAQFGYPPQTSISSSAEQAFLSAVMSVNDITPVVVAFAEGFGEGGGNGAAYAGMEDLLYKNSYIIETVNMMSGEDIDPEIDFLVIHTPMYDYTLNALDKIDVWLDNDGMYGKTLIYIPIIGYEIRPTPNLDSFLSEWGIRVEQGYVSQRDNRYASAADSYEQLIRAVDFTDGVEENPLLGAYMRPLSLLFETSTGFATSVLLTTFEGTIFIPFEFFDEALEDEERLGLLSAPQVFDVGVMSQKQRYEGFEQLSSNIIVFGSPEIFNPFILETDRFSNARFLLNVFGDLSGREENTVMIMPKSFRMTGFEITARQANSIALVFVIILPMVIIAAGLAVFFKRRYK
ncbi:MAG: GldG family protein [Oscillospiraceae bacterium]|nr:GldG family protein [Oscillospiraceae bacterium]